MPFISSLITAASTAWAGVTAAFSAGGLFAAGTVGGVVARAVLSVGLSLGLSAFSRSSQRKQAATQAADTATSTVEVGGDIPRQVALGRRVGTKGHLTHIWSHGTPGNPTNYLSQIHVLSDGRIGGLVGVWIAGKRYELRQLTPTNFEAARYDTAEKSSPYFEIRFFDGRPGQLGPADFLASLGVPDFPSTARGAGVAYVVTTLQNVNSYWSGAPDLIFEIDGYRCYDPRKDSTVGGSGPHLWDDPATWESTDNPAVQIYNYLRGIRCEGQVFMGLEVPSYDLNLDSFITAANICDEQVPLDAGGTEARYRSACVISAEETDHRSALAPLVQAMAGYLYERTGEFGVIPGAAQLSVATITDDDIVWTAGVRWSGSRSRSERVNEVHGQFVDPTAGWQANSYPAVKSASALAEDGERLATQLDLRAVSSVTQAQRIARARLRETRRQRSASLTVARRLLRLEIGDWITWSSARYGAAVYRITGWQRLGDDTTRIELDEIGGEVYSWSSVDEQPFQPPFGGTTPAAGISTVSNFTVQADVAPGTGRPIAKLTWDPIEDERVKAVIIEYRAVDTVLATRVRDDSPLDGLFVLDQPPTGAEYEYRATIVTEPPRPTTWTSWVRLTIAEPVIDILNQVPPEAPTGLSVTSTIVIGLGGDILGVVTATWSAANARPATFEAELSTDNGLTWRRQTVGNALRAEWRGFKPGTTVLVRVRALNFIDQASGYTSIVTHVVAANTTPPDDVSNVTLDAAGRTVFLNWQNPGNSDLRDIEIWESATPNRADGFIVARMARGSTSFVREGLAVGGQRWYWLRPFNTSGIGAVNYIQPTPTNVIVTGTVAVDLGLGLDIPGSKATLVDKAAPGYAAEPSLVLNTTDRKLYRKDPVSPTGWTAAVAAADVTGQLTSAQIADLAAAKLTGQITETQIADSGITTPKIAAGAVVTASLAAGSVTAEKAVFSTSRNLAANSDFAAADAAGAPLYCTSSDTATGSLTRFFRSIAAYGDALSWNQNIPAGMTGFGYFIAGAPQAGSTAYVIFRNPSNTNGYYPVSGGKRYELSLYLGVTNCAASVTIAYYTADGIFISSQSSAASSAMATNTGMAGYPRVSLFSTAPANAASANIYVFGSYNGASNPGIWGTGLHFGEAGVSQTDLTPWAPAEATVIDGAAIKTRTLDASRIVANSIDTSELKANAVTAGVIAAGAVIADKIGANQVTAGKIASNAVTTDALQAGSITGAKAAFANNANVIPNADFSVANPDGTPALWSTGGNAPSPQLYQVASVSGIFGWNAFLPAGMPGYALQVASLTNGTYQDLYATNPSQGPGDLRFPVIGGRRYEASAYLAPIRARAYVLIFYYDSAGAFITAHYGSVIQDAPRINNGLSTYSRSVLFSTAPSTAVTAAIGIRHEFYGLNAPFGFGTGVYFGEAFPNQTEASTWAPAETTIINGGGIQTGTLTARAVAAQTLTGDKIAGNTIEARSLRINARGITNVLGLDFGLGRTASALTGTIDWSDGYIFWIDDNGNNQATAIAAGSVDSGGNGVYFYWTKGAGVISTVLNDWPSVAINPDNVLVASYRSGSPPQLTVTYGGTIVDGDRITASSIQANRLSVAELSAIAASLGVITAGYMQSPDGRVRMNLERGVTEVFDAAGNLRMRWGNLNATAFPPGA